MKQALWLLCWLAWALLTGCAGLPPRGDAPASAALSHTLDTQDTSLARMAAASRPPQETAPSGFRLLPTGEFALNARLAVARRAEKSLDLQYYHLHPDVSGRLLLRELRDAAARGVRVRLLVDDYHAAEIDELLLGLAAHANVQVRLFNPLPLRRGDPLLRLLLSSGDFEQHNRRMHNKLFVADNAVAIYGGRNIADAYFMHSAQANFIDLDLLSTGQVVPELSAAFDRYWNSTLAWPLHTVLGAPRNADRAQAEFDAAVRDASPPVAAYLLDPLGQTAVGLQLDAGRLAQTYGDAAVFADPPDKAASKVRLQQATAAMGGLLQAMADARNEVLIVSPYFVPGDVGMPMMARATRAGVRTTVFTNSLGSTDEPLVHHMYSRYRADMLRLGVELYEFSPTLTQRTFAFGDFGRSTPRLHAKVALVDRRRLLVGSVNLDARSAIGNTEMGVVIDSQALAGTFYTLMAPGRARNTYKLRLATDGTSIEWTSTDTQGQSIVHTQEPEDSVWQRFKFWLQTLFVDERLL